MPVLFFTIFCFSDLPVALDGQPPTQLTSLTGGFRQTDWIGTGLDSTTVTKLEGHAELVTELVNPLLQTYIIANDDNYGAQLAA